MRLEEAQYLLNDVANATLDQLSEYPARPWTWRQRLWDRITSRVTMLRERAGEIVAGRSFDDDY